MEIGNNIKKIRELRDYKQEFMAQSLGISQSYYNKIEKNPAKISVEMLYKIGQVLEVHPSVLLDFDVTNYVHSISNSHFGFRDYINQNDVLQNTLITALKEEVKFLREMLKQKLNN